VNYENCGYVYAITNTVNGGSYIGSTTNLASRWKTHRYLLRKGKHHSFILQKAWDKYGETSFSFAPILVCSKHMRGFYENALIKLARYNVVKTDVFKEVCGAKISAALRGRKKTESHRKAISAGKTGVAMGDSFKQKARLRQLGVSLSSATRSRLSDSLKQARHDEKEASRQLSILVYSKFKLGDSVEGLCRLHGITSATFYNHCVAMNLPSVKHKAIELAVGKVKSLLECGSTLTSACRELGLNPKTMSAVLLRRAKHG